MGVSQFICLLAFILFFNGILAKPSLIPSEDLAVEYNPDYVISKPDLIQSKELAQELKSGNLVYPEHYRVRIQPKSGYTGFRSVFQWNIGETIDNYGIQNVVEFKVKDSANSQLVGNIGILNNGSDIEIQLSLDTITQYGSINYTIYSNKSVISNGIYFLDVEIYNHELTGYISEPQQNLWGRSNLKLPRKQFGVISWMNKFTELIPESYVVANSYKSCNDLSEITVFNYLPVLYNTVKQELGDFYQSLLQVFLNCGPVNTLALTDWTTIVYISRPSIVLNGTSVMNYLENESSFF